jgi:hypothetical protein
MTKRDIIETVYEYDNDGKLLKKTVTKTHEEDNAEYQSSWSNIPITCLDN